MYIICIADFFLFSSVVFLFLCQNHNGCMRRAGYLTFEALFLCHLSFADIIGNICKGKNHMGMAEMIIKVIEAVSY
jgi:hypothetical protein